MSALRPIIALLSLLAALALASSASAATVVPVAGDAYVRSDVASTNFGSEQLLQVDGSPRRVALLYFPNTPSGVTAATLRVYSTWHTGQPLSVRQISCAGWSEGTVTYNSYQAVQKGAVVATIPDDPVGWLSVTIPTSVINASFGGTSSNANCFAVEKAGDLWMNLRSRENAGYGAQLVVQTSTSTPPPTTAVSGCGDAPAVNVTPSTMGSVLSSYNRVRVTASPGTYSSLSMHKTTSDSCVSIKCSVAAKSGTFSWNTSGCLIAGQSTIESIRDLTIEGFVVRTTGDGTYGFALYDESPHVGMRTRIAGNVFADSTDHDISTKERELYTEVVSNWFLNCRRHCWEIGQNGNIRTRPSTTMTSVFTGNVAYSATGNIITQRYNLNLTVSQNTFKGAAGRVVMNWPYWAKYPFGASGDDGSLYVPGTKTTSDPKVPLRTTVTGNTFSGKSDLLFISRGVRDDVVLVKGNTGITSCGRVQMDYWDSGTSAAHINEETTAPPLRDSASDIAC